MATLPFDPKQPFSPEQLAQFEEFFEGFMKILKDDHQGENAKQHITAYPIHTVQRERLITGIDTQFTDNICAMDVDTNVYFSPVEAWEALTELDQEDVLADTDLEDEEPFVYALIENLNIERFSNASEANQWRLVGLLDNVSAVTGYEKIWEFESAHLTSDSAENKRERLSNRLGADKVKVYVDSGYDSYEYTTIINALLSGLLAPVKT